MVEIARYPSAIEAAAARNRLDDADISACLDGEAMATWFWYLGSAIGGVKLFVDARYADRASAILSTPADVTVHFRAAPSWWQVVGWCVGFTGRKFLATGANDRFGGRGRVGFLQFGQFRFEDRTAFGKPALDFRE